MQKFRFQFILRMLSLRAYLLSARRMSFIAFSSSSGLLVNSMSILANFTANRSCYYGVAMGYYGLLWGCHGLLRVAMGLLW